MWSVFLLICYFVSGFTEATNKSQLCTLPPYPANGRYTVLEPEGNLLGPGDTVNKYTIKVTCDKGYHNADNEVLTCWNDGHVEGEISECLPYCTRQKNEVLSCGIAQAGKEVRCIAPPSEFVTLAAQHTPVKEDDDDDDDVDEFLNEKSRCGVPVTFLPIIAGGETVIGSAWPWHAGVYTKKTFPYMQICGGSVVSKNVVISAAHCFWNEVKEQFPPSQYAVAAGKLHRPWTDFSDEYAQKSDVSQIRIPPHFHGHTTNLQDDIAILFLATPFRYTIHLLPICLDFNADNDREDLDAGSLGTVAGWGLTSADGHASQVLKNVELPIVGLSQCFNQSDPAFRSYITSDKICAGYQNGTAVCKGDSGGGLAFPSSRRGRERFFLRGLVSGSPQSEHLCNTLTWASFTHVIKHERFITESMAAATAILDSMDQSNKNN